MRFKKTSREMGFFVKILKICKKSAATEGFFPPSPLLRAQILFNYSADEKYLRDQNLRGHFEETVIYHIEKSVGRYHSFRNDRYILFQKDSLLSNFMGLSMINL